MSNRFKAPLRGAYHLPTVTSSLWRELAVGQSVSIKLDPYGKTTQRKHPDPNALAVFDCHNRHIGYLPANNAAILAKPLQEGILQITGTLCWVDEPYNAQIECTLLEQPT